MTLKAQRCSSVTCSPQPIVRVCVSIVKLINIILSCLHCFPFSSAPITFLFHSLLSTFFSLIWTSPPTAPISLFFPTHPFLLSFSTLLTPPFLFHIPISPSCPIPPFLSLPPLPSSSLHHSSSCLPPHVSFYLFCLCRVWEVTTGEVLNTLIHHNEAVLHLRFANGLMVTCSKDRSIAVWDMASPTDISLRRVLVGHRAAVNVVDFDDKYIVSASGDRTIKVTRAASTKLDLSVN